MLQGLTGGEAEAEGGAGSPRQAVEGPTPARGGLAPPCSSRLTSLYSKMTRCRKDSPSSRPWRCTAVISARQKAALDVLRAKQMAYIPFSVPLWQARVLQLTSNFVFSGTCIYTPCNTRHSPTRQLRLQLPWYRRESSPPHTLPPPGQFRHTALHFLKPIARFRSSGGAMQLGWPTGPRGWPLENHVYLFVTFANVFNGFHLQ